MTDLTPERLAELEAEVDAFKAAALLGEDSASVTPEMVESHITDLRAEVERLRRDLRAACAECGSDNPDLQKNCPLEVAQRERAEARAALAEALREAEERNPQIVCPKCGEGSIDQPHLHACLADMLAQARRDAFREAAERWSNTLSGHYAHHDPKGTAGANCPACQESGEFTDWLRAKVEEGA